MIAQYANGDKCWLARLGKTWAVCAVQGSWKSGKSAVCVEVIVFSSWRQTCNAFDVRQRLAHGKLRRRKCPVVLVSSAVILLWTSEWKVDKGSIGTLIKLVLSESLDAPMSHLLFGLP